MPAWAHKCTPREPSLVRVRPAWCVCACVGRSVTSWAVALTSVSPGAFAGGTAVAMVPYVALYAWLGSASTDIAKVLAGRDGGVQEGASGCAVRRAGSS